MPPKTGLQKRSLTRYIGTSSVTLQNNKGFRMKVYLQVFQVSCLNQWCTQCTRLRQTRSYFLPLFCSCCRSSILSLAKDVGIIRYPVSIDYIISHQIADNLSQNLFKIDILLAQNQSCSILNLKWVYVLISSKAIHSNLDGCSRFRCLLDCIISNFPLHIGFDQTNKTDQIRR